MKTKSSKAKGGRLQKIVRNYILNTLPLLPHEIKSTTMGEKGEDIQRLTEKAKKLFAFQTECKNQEALSLWQAWEQCAERRTETDVPLLVVTRNRSPVLVIQLASDWFKQHATLIKLQYPEEYTDVQTK